MALPVIASVTFDKASYAIGDTITATVKYSGTNLSNQNFTLNATVTDTVTSEAGTAAGTFAVDNKPNPLAASVAGGETGQVWTKASDDGVGTAVFTAKAA